MTSESQKRYELLDHTADVGVVVYGDDLASLYANAGYALAALLAGDPAAVRPESSRRFEVEALDRDDLMVRWLNDLIYAFEVESFVPGDFRIVELTGTRLVADVMGETFDHTRHGHGVQVKAATYHQLDVEQGPDGRWNTAIIFDV